MKALKKLIALSLAGIILFSFAGCGKDNKSPSKQVVEKDLVSSASTVKETVELFFKAYFEPNFKEASRYQILGSDGYYNYCAEKEGKKLDEYYKSITDGNASSFSEYCEYRDKNKKEQLQKGDEEIGKNIKMTKIEIESDDTMTQEELDELKKEFDDNDYIEKDKITEAHKVKATFTIEGSKSSDTASQTLTIVKYKDEWKIAG